MDILIHLEPIPHPHRQPKRRDFSGPDAASTTAPAAFSSLNERSIRFITMAVTNVTKTMNR